MTSTSQLHRLMTATTSSSSSSSLPQSSLALSTYSLEKLLQLWRRKELTVEQAVGHLHTT